MNKQEFLDKLRAGLSGLPRQDVEERLAFYAEMIDDRTEDGLSEAEAVAAVGTVEEIVAQVLAETPFAKLAVERVKPKHRLEGWEIVLLVVGSPLWLSLVIAAVSVIFSLYAVLWSLIVALWSLFGAFVGGAFGGLLGGIVLALAVNPPAGLALIAAGLVLAGLSILLFIGCKAATAGIVWLTKRILLGMKNALLKKEEIR